MTDTAAGASLEQPKVRAAVKREREGIARKAEALALVRAAKDQQRRDEDQAKKSTKATSRASRRALAAGATTAEVLAALGLGANSRRHLYRILSYTAPRKRKTDEGTDQ